MRYSNLTLFAVLASIGINCVAQECEPVKAPGKVKGVQLKDVKRVLMHKNVDYAYVRPEIVELLEKMAPGVCSCCTEVCELYEQVCEGYRTAPYTLVEKAVCKMIERCPDEVARVCLKKYAEDLKDKRMLITMKEAPAPCCDEPVTRVLPVCNPDQDCPLVPPAFQDFDCPTPASATPVPPTPADENPLLAPTAVIECVLPDGAVVLCDIEVGSITADEIQVDNLCVEEDINLNGSLIADENVSAQGNVIAGGILSAGDDIIGGADLQLTGTIYANGDLNIGGSGYIGGDLNVIGDIVAGGQVIFSGAIVTDDLCAANLQAQTAILGNTKLCEVVLENLYVSGLVQFARGTGAFCEPYPSKQGYGEIYFTANDLVYVDCPASFADITGCVSVIPNLNAARYTYLDDGGGYEFAEFIFGARLKNLGADMVPQSIPHIDFAVPGDIDLNPNCEVQLDLHLVSVNGTTAKNVNIATLINRSGGDCGSAVPLDGNAGDIQQPCAIPTVTDPITPQQQLFRVATELSQFPNLGAVSPGDWLRLSFVVTQTNAQGSGLLDDTDCVLINSVVVRYPRVDAFDAMLPCAP